MHPYPSTLILVVGDTLEDSRVKMGKLTKGREPSQDVLSLAGAACCERIDPKTGAQDIYLLFPRRTKASIIAHECVHAVNFVYAAKGVQWDFVNDEPHAYFLGLLVGTVTEFIRNAR